MTQGPDGDQAAGEVTEEEVQEERPLEQQLAEARAEAKKNFELYLRARAEQENMAKRHERDRSERLKYAAEPLARDLLSSIDDLERALDHADEGGAGFAEGVELVLRGLLTALEKHGINKMEVVGKSFDPSEHEAVAMLETPDASANSVIEVHRAGYRFKDRLLRPALVVVAKAAVEPGPTQNSESAAEAGDGPDNGGAKAEKKG